MNNLLRRVALPIAVVLLTWALSGALPAHAGNVLNLDFSPSPLAARLRRAETPKKTLSVPRCTQPPKVDGRLDDDAWRAAVQVNAAPDTVVRVCYDVTAIYLGVECKAMAGSASVPKSPERDSNDIWKADHIEMWLAPVPKGTVFQFAVDLRNLIYDGTVTGVSADAGYNPDWSHAVRRDAQSWTAEVAIPRRALRLGQWPREIGFDLGRDGGGHPTRSWVGEWGNTANGKLVLEGITAETHAAGPDESAAQGSALRVSIPRPYARPGDRWIEAGLTISPALAEALPGLRVTAVLWPLGADAPVASTSGTPARAEGKLRVDLRTPGLRAARLRVALLDGQKELSVTEHFLNAQQTDAPLTEGTKIPITIDPPAGSQVERYPVTFGVPFAPGALWDVARLRAVDAQGRELPCQKTVTALWAPEGAIRWVRFDAIVSSRDGCFVEVASAGPGANPPRPLTLVEHDGALVLDTGAASYTLGKGPSPIQEMRVGNAVVARSAGTRGLYVVDQKGRTASAAADDETMEVELSGPIACCVRFEGFYRTTAGANLARHITRVEAFAGQPFARVTHTLVLTGDTNELWFKEIGWEFAASPGAEPRAVFGASRDDAAKRQVLPLAAGAAAYMLQDQHYRFGAGKNHFSIAQARPGAVDTTVTEGEECGDFALVLGRSAGLMMGCKEAARQHPKEFEVHSDRITLKLFSNRAGEELDFRMPALIKKWNLADWIKKSMVKYELDRVPPNALETVSKHPTNACGWAKTHDLIIGPAASAEQAATASWLHSRSVFAHTDPAWVCRSGAVGRIHPRDPKRFPREEGLIDATFQLWEKRALAGWGNFGFVDYGAGPNISYTAGDVPNLYRYMKFTYSLRSDLWMQYARSGARRVRELAELTNRTYFDNAFAHWDSQERTAGLPAMPRADSFPAIGGMPAYWEGYHYPNLMSSSNLNQFAWFHYFTGSGRAKDGVLEYADGIRRYWTPARARQDSRAIVTMRLMMQCYEFNWDPMMLALAEATTDIFYDPETAVALSKDRDLRSSTYKTQVDVAGLLDAWTITGSRRYYDMAMAVSRYWWRGLLGRWPIFYFNPQGRIGQFLYDETGDPSVAQGLLIQMRQAATAYTPETGKVIGKTDGRVGAEDASFVFSGIPFAQEVVVRTDADKNTPVSWLGWDDYGAETGIYVMKDDNDTVIVDLQNAGQTGKRAGGIEAAHTVQGQQYGLDLVRVEQWSNGGGTICINKDAPPGCYEITSSAMGQHTAIAHSRVPMVLYAPGYWQPRPDLGSPPRWYFNIPRDAKNPQICFDGPAKVYDPAGRSLSETPSLTGWVNLPADRPGLWSFEPINVRAVCVRNIPPFFAPDLPTSYFTPEIAWKTEDQPVAHGVPPGTLYIPGPGGDAENKALSLDGKRAFRLNAGDVQAAGDGSQFLPFKQGTIEFFMRPAWDVSELPDGTPRFVRMATNKDDWSLWYLRDSKTAYPWFSNSLHGWFMTDGASDVSSIRTYRRTVFMPGEWVHLAWTWGTISRMDYHGRTTSNLVTRVYVNGRAGQQYSWTLKGNQPRDPPSALMLMNILPGKSTAYDELRISDTIRYTGDFTPPVLGTEFRVDAHTRALFHFNGNIEGKSAGAKSPLPATLVP